MVKIDNTLKNLIERNPIAFSTCYKNKPNVIYVSCVKIISKDTLLITDNYMSKTKKNLFKNKNIALVVCNSKGNCGYQLKGKANYLIRGKWLTFVKNMRENKEMPTKAAILIKVKEIYKLA